VEKQRTRRPSELFKAAAEHEHERLSAAPGDALASGPDELRGSFER